MKAQKVVFSLCLVVIGFLAVIPVFPGAPPETLAQRVDAILSKPWLRRVAFSACLVRRQTGEIVYEKNSHLPLLPASNMKIVTTAAALERLGPDFAFITRVGLCGDSLVIVGSGDPLLGDREKGARNGPRAPHVIQEILAGLKQAAISSIKDIILDTSIFDSERIHPTWPREQLNQRYECEVSGLNYNGNCVEIAAVNRGGRVVLLLDPPTSYLKLINAVAPGPDRKSWFSVDRTSIPGELLVQGSCRTEAGPYSVAVENPAVFFGRLLQEALAREGVAVGGRIFESVVPESCKLREIAEFQTSLADCLQRTNKDSLGLAAESLLKRVGAQTNPGGKLGSWEGGRRVISDYVRSLGVNDSEFTIADGSGLSRDNRLSANALTQVLMHLASGPNWEFFKSSLAVGGLDGTIESHFYEAKYRGRVLAKSGYIQAVRALSGVVRTDSGEFIFSFLANRAGNGARMAIDAAVKAVVDWGAVPTFPRQAQKR